MPPVHEQRAHTLFFEQLGVIHAVIQNEEHGRRSPRLDFAALRFNQVLDDRPVEFMENERIGDP